MINYVAGSLPHGAKVRSLQQRADLLANLLGTELPYRLVHRCSDERPDPWGLGSRKGPEDSKLLN